MCVVCIFRMYTYYVRVYVHEYKYIVWCVYVICTYM